jgi:hypothetical protein
MGVINDVEGIVIRHGGAFGRCGGSGEMLAE